MEGNVRSLVKKILRQLASSGGDRKKRVNRCPSAYGHSVRRHRKGWKYWAREAERKRRDELMKKQHRLRESSGLKSAKPKVNLCPNCGTHRESDMWCDRCEEFVYDY